MNNLLCEQRGSEGGILGRRRVGSETRGKGRIRGWWIRRRTSRDGGWIRRRTSRDERRRKDKESGRDGRKGGRGGREGWKEE